MSTLSPLLMLQDIEVVYGAAILAVRDVSLHVGRCEIVALLGANGAGKSSTLRAVSNLLGAQRGRVTRGRITFDGRAIAGVPTSQLVSSGLVQVLEGRHCFRGLTIEENLITGAIGRQATRAETAVDLDRVYALFPRLQVKRRVLAGLTLRRRAADGGHRSRSDGAGRGCSFSTSRPWGWRPSSSPRSSRR